MAPIKPNTTPTQNAELGISSLELNQVRSKKRFPKIRAAIKPTKAKISHLPKNFIYNSKIFFFYIYYIPKYYFQQGAKILDLNEERLRLGSLSFSTGYFISITFFFFASSSSGGMTTVKIASLKVADVFSVFNFTIGIL